MEKMADQDKDGDEVEDLRLIKSNSREKGRSRDE